MTLDELLHDERPVIEVPEAGSIFGLGRSASYACASRGEIPTLRLGRRLLVPVPRLREMLGLPSNSDSRGE